jgi:hypothetical protein
MHINSKRATCSIEDAPLKLVLTCHNVHVEDALLKLV